MRAKDMFSRTAATGCHGNHAGARRRILPATSLLIHSSEERGADQAKNVGQHANTLPEIQYYVWGLQGGWVDDIVS